MAEPLSNEDLAKLIALGSGGKEEPAATPGKPLSSSELAAMIVQKPSKTGMLESLGRGAVEGATFGFDSKFGPDWKAAREQSKKDNPWTHFAGEVVGSVAPIAMTGGAAALPGAAGRVAAGVGRAVLPTSATTYMGAIGQGVRTGGALGALSGAGHADVQDSDTMAEALAKRGTGALYGGATGAALGVPFGIAGQAISRGVGNIANTVQSRVQPLPQELAGYDRGSVQRVARAALDDGNGGIPPTPGHAEMMIGDMGPNLRGQMGALASQPGVNQSAITRALETRRDGAAGRITAEMDRTLGPAQDLVHLEEQTSRILNARADPLYRQFHATPLRVTPELTNALHRADAAGAVATASREMRIDGHDVNNATFNGMFVDYIKQAVDDMASVAIQKGERGAARRFTRLAAAIREETDRILSPNDPAQSIWAQARRTAGEGGQFGEGLEEGAKAFSRGTHPDQLRADIARMSPPERTGYTMGARGQVRDTIGNAANAMRQNGDIKALQQLGSPYARDKLEQIAADPQRVQALTSRLDAEARFSDTYNQTLANSKTAARQAAQEEFPNAATASASPDLSHVTATGLALQGVRKIVDSIRAGAITEKQIAISRDAARMLIAQGADRDAILQGLHSYVQSQHVTMRQQAAISRVIRSLMSAAPAAVTGTMLGSPSLQR